MFFVSSAAKEKNQKVRVCAEHLRQYNEALHQSNTIRMSDAFRFLDKYYTEELKTKSSTDEDNTITITDTERFLFNLFKGTHGYNSKGGCFAKSKYTSNLRSCLMN